MVPYLRKQVRDRSCCVQPRSVLNGS